MKELKAGYQQEESRNFSIMMKSSLLLRYSMCCYDNSRWLIRNLQYKSMEVSLGIKNLKNLLFKVSIGAIFSDIERYQSQSATWKALHSRGIGGKWKGT